MGSIFDATVFKRVLNFSQRLDGMHGMEDLLCAWETPTGRSKEDGISLEGHRPRGLEKQQLEASVWSIIMITGISQYVLNLQRCRSFPHDSCTSDHLDHHQRRLLSGSLGKLLICLREDTV